MSSFFTIVVVQKQLFYLFLCNIQKIYIVAISTISYVNSFVSAWNNNKITGQKYRNLIHTEFLQDKRTPSRHRNLGCKHQFVKRQKMCTLVNIFCCSHNNVLIRKSQLLKSEFKSILLNHFPRVDSFETNCQKQQRAYLT